MSTISIIGSGGMAAAIGGRTAKAGHTVEVVSRDPAKARVSTFLESLELRPFDVGGLHMAQTLEALGLMMIGLAKNGAGTWDFAMNVDLG
ncbi:MAG TPA: NAD(P)-binding domain-containing protein [Telmatospirillum sp.]|nr:NAD(P)-binding domain-containing protein [Telmatospirillum sp.]